MLTLPRFTPPSPLARADCCALLVIDLQPSFLKAIPDAERIVRRCRFLVEVAGALEVPILATEQNAARMGGTDASIRELLEPAPLDKMSFSCAGAPGFSDRFLTLGRRDVVLVGIETHICVNQTAHHLIEAGCRVFLPVDALGCRSEAAHTVGLRRMEVAGAVLTHTESLAYEWMGTAEHPRFRDVLEIVKRYA